MDLEVGGQNKLNIFIVVWHCFGNLKATLGSVPTMNDFFVFRSFFTGMVMPSKHLQ